MSPERWKQVRATFELAVQCEAGQRGAVLDKTCAGNPELRAEVEELIARDAEVARVDFLPSPCPPGSPSQACPGEAAGSPPVQSIPAGYEVLGELGRGGMGVVYKARQIKANRPVALKMLLAGGHADAAEMDRFRIDAEAIAQLQHPNIVQVFEVGEHQGVPFFSLEFCPGGGLDRKLAGSPLPPVQAAALMERLAVAVQAAHEKHIIHRDLKPANVLLAEDGTPKITDFGLAKKIDEGGGTVTGVVMGTPSYMPPEQARGQTKEIGPAADVYALGAILYECLTGRPPFRAATVLETLEQVRGQEPVPPRLLQPAVPRDLETICLMCLHKEQRRRYDSAAELGDDLRRFLDGKPVRARPVGAWERGLKWARRRPAWAALVAVSALAVLALVGVAVTLAVTDWQVRRAKARTEAQYQLARKAVEEYFTTVSEDEDLKAQGLEPLRKKLLESARAFYEKFIEERSGDRELQAELALANSRLGVITLAIDSKVKAIGYFKQANGIFEGLAKSQPADAKYQRELARNYYNLGYLHRETGDLAAAKSFLDQAVALQKGLDPARVDYRHDLALSYNELGNVYRTAFAADNAAEAYKDAVETFGRLVDADPNNASRHRSGMAMSLQNLGELYRSTGKPAQAQDTARQALAIQEKLAKSHPLNTKYQRDLALTHTNLGILAYFASQHGEAEKEYQRALEIGEELTRLHPQVAEWQVDLTNVYNNLAMVYGDIKQLDKAKELHKKAIAVRRRLIQDGKGTPELQRLLASSYQNLGNVYYQSRQPALAKENYLKAVEILKGLVKDYGGVLQYQVDLGGTTGNLGQLAAASGHHKEALDWLDQTITTLEAVLQKQPNNVDAQRFLANARRARAATPDQLNRPK
jgi:serine/threonine protein kinase/tetratricopeptide (TPR) repeat protein